MEETLLDIALLMIVAASISIFLAVDLSRRRSYKRSESYERNRSTEARR